MYKLSRRLVGHEQDVRGVVSPENGKIISSSRDGTTRSWDFGTEGNVTSTIKFHSPSNSFINAVEYIPDRSLVASGGQDAMIYLSEYHSFDTDSQFQLIGHQGNVCSLHYSNGELASGSWDCTGKVWDLDQFCVKFDLVGHEYSVWDIKVLGGNKYLTCSADKTIRLWDGHHEVRKYVGHTDVVRKLAILSPDKFASCSNDGTIKIWSIEGNLMTTLHGHESFVYDLAVHHDTLISVGEDRTARIWKLDSNFTSGQIHQVITIPAISVWCVDTLPNGDFVAGSSDNKLYVFTQSSGRVASEAELNAFKSEVELSSISEQSLDQLNRTDIPSYDALKNPGKTEGSVIMVKNAAGVIEAHQWSGGEWVKIGDVVGGTQSKTKQEFDGQQWDYVFDVDIEDGAPPLKLPYNINENPYVAAERFLSKNELPSSYTEEVVRFINKNTEGFKLDQNAGPVENPYADRPVPSEPSLEQQQALSIIPEKTYILFKDFKVEPLIKGLNKFNDQQIEAKFAGEEIAMIQSYLNNLTSKNAIELINGYIVRIVDSWGGDSRLLAYDLLRCCIPKIVLVDLINSTETAENVLKIIKSAVESPAIASTMMILRCISNIIDTTLFIQLFIDPNDAGKYEFSQLFVDFLTPISKFVSSCNKQDKLYGNLMTSLATMIYNVSAYFLKNINTFASVDPIIEFAEQVGQTITEASSEASYRLFVAYGNFKYGKKFSKAPQWAGNFANYDEDRFKKVQADIQSLE